MHTNYVTKKEYTGENNLTLEETKAMIGFSTNEWMTFIQARNNGMKVKKGQKGIKLKRVLEYSTKNKKTGKIEDKFGIRSFTVFNLDQVEKNK